MNITIALAISPSGGRFAAIKTHTAPSRAVRKGEARATDSSNARAIRSSPVPCCQSAWLEIIQVLVPKANANASGRLQRLFSRRSTKNIRTLATEARNDAEIFSINSATRSICGCSQPWELSQITAGRERGGTNKRDKKR